METPAALPAGARVRLEVMPTGLELSGSVVYCHQQEHLYRLGVRFEVPLPRERVRALAP